MAPSQGTAVDRPVTIGVDIGGTHTDMIISEPSGLTRCKAFSTHDDYSRGVLAALDVAAEQLGTTPQDLLTRCGTFVGSSTIVTNIVTEKRGPDVGVLITAGFKDTFRVARGARKAAYDDHAQTTPPDVVPRDCIAEIDERVLSDGSVARPLDEDGLRVAVRRLRDRGVQAYAVCYLWSFVHDEHERRTREVILEEDPGATVMLSSRVHPVIRETERFYTTVFNAVCHPAVGNFVGRITSALGALGFAGSLSFFQGIGGSASGAAVTSRPMTLLASGPAGGLMGARALGKRLGLTDVIVGDLGGTSFDASLMRDLEPRVAKRVTFDQIPTGVDILDVVSVGSGGGSIVRLDSRGIPQVGPASAGSNPGPACYGLGGTDPTVTDACLVLGLIDPENYLQGRHKLDVDAARAAIAKVVAEPLGWSVEAAAAGIYDIAVVTMADAMRTVSVERGQDPRRFTFVAYGGGLGLFAGEVARRLGCRDVIIPDNCSAFSAQGVLTADYVRQYNRTVNWDMSVDADRVRVNSALADMRAEALADAVADGMAQADVRFSTTAECRFAGQAWEITVPLPDREVVLGDGPALATRFPSIYEDTYGPGTAWRDAPAMMVNVGLKATVVRPDPALREGPLAEVTPQPVARRAVHLPGHDGPTDIAVFAEADMTPGAEVTGPCIVDVGDTTIFVVPGLRCRRDSLFNFRLDASSEVSR